MSEKDEDAEVVEAIDPVEVAKPDGDETTDYKAKADGLEADLTKANVELEKLKGKDISFKKLKDMTEGEKKKYDEEKEQLSTQVKTLQEQIESNERRQVEEWFTSAAHVVTNGDEDKIKEIKVEYDLLNMPSSTRIEVMARMNKAMTLAGIEVGGDLNAISFGSGREPQRQERRFTDSDRGKATLDMLAPDLAKANKKNNE